MTQEAVVVKPRETVLDSKFHFKGPDQATVALLLLMLAGGLLLMYAGRYLTFFYDEWTFVLIRRGSGIDTYLNPHNGHLLLFSVLVYKLLFATVGLRHYTPYRLVGTALHLLCVWLLYVLARRRLGPVPALVPALLLLFLGTASEDLLWPFQMAYLGSIAGGLGALVLLDRPTRPRDGWATAMLVWSVASSGVGIAFAAACGVLLISQRASWRRLWVAIVPLLVYVVWYVGWGGGDQTSTSAVLGAPQYVADAAAGAVAGLAGLNDATWGPALAVALLGLIILEWRRRYGGSPSPMLLTAAAGALVFWVLTAVARATETEPAASRYVYVGVVFILLAASEARLGLAVRGWWLALIGILVLGAVLGNIGALRTGERSLRAADTDVRASLGAVQIAAPVVSPTFPPALSDAPQLTAGPYLAAVHHLGSPALTPSQLLTAPELTRETADGVLVHAEALGASATTTALGGGVSPTVEYVDGARLSVGGPCDRLTPTASLASLGLRLYPGAKLIVQSSKGPVTNVYARRFAASFAGPPFATLAAGVRDLIGFPLDQAPSIPWHVQLVAAAPISVCMAG